MSYRIDLTPNASYTETVSVSQDDVGREIVIDLYKDGTSYTPASGTTITMQGTKPSGLGYTITGTASGSTVTFLTTLEMTQEAGRFASEIVLTNGSTVIGTANFALYVEKNPHPENTIDGTEETMQNLTVRMDELEDDVAADNAELIDIRVGADGVTYSSAGDAVRGQVNALNSTLDYFSNVNTTLFDGYINNSGIVSPATSDGQKCTDFISVAYGTFVEAKVVLSAAKYRNIAIFGYASDKSFVERIDKAEGGAFSSVTISATISNESIKYVRVSFSAYGLLSSFTAKAYMSSSSIANVAYNADAKVTMLEAETADIVPISSLKYSFAKSGTTWNVSIPKNLAAINPHTGNPFAFITLESAQTVAVASGQLLYYDWTSNVFASALAQNIDASKPYTIVLYNSYGYLQGRWVEYYKDDYIKATVTAKSRILFPASSLTINFRRNADNSFSVSVPNSIGIINAVENTYTTKNFQGVYVVPYNNYLVYDASADNLQIVRDVNLSENENITVLLFNSYGVIQGQWAAYANNQNFESINGTVKILAHQGSGLMESDGLGHSKLSAYLAAWSAGFDMGECDLKFTSDGIPVCCHDATFTSGSTVVTIANTTFEQLKTYSYYGGTIASLDEVVSLCKTLGMDLQIDQLASTMTDAQWNAVFAIIKKYRMFDHVIFTGSQATINKIQGFYANARIMLLATSSAELTSQLALAESIVTDKNEIIVAFNYGVTTADNIPTYTQDIDPRVKLGAWIIDYASVALQYIPYVDYITSNKVPYKAIASSIK